MAVFEPAISVDDFSTSIEKLVSTKRIPYIDAVILWCGQHSIEVEYAADWIKKADAIKTKIQAEAEDLNILKRSANLTSFMK